MKYIISIFEFLFKVLSPLAYFAASGIGQLMVGCVGLSSAFYALRSDLGSITTSLVDFFNTATVKVDAFISWLTQQQYWSFFYDLFALDVFGTVFSTFLTFVFFCISFIVLQAFLSSLFVLIPFIFWKVTSKILSVLSMGYVKTS